ncbi:MAG: radical SAM protein, partial [Planctomycetes bacterium]|nr:radical SAM protein [Planctomycetota bacterium]
MPTAVAPLPSPAAEKHKSGDFNHSPLVVFFEVTQACDLVCQHCRACAQRLADANELSSGVARQLIDQLTEFPQPPLLVLTGGDPFKRADIFSLVEYASNAGLEVAITPSATPLVTPSRLRRLRDAGIARVALSLDGANEVTHDTFRGVEGSFDRTLEILLTANVLGIPTQVNTTVTPRNASQLDELAETLANLEIVLWSVFFLVPTGRAAGMPRLTAEECERVFERLWHHARRQPYAIKTTEAPHFRRFVAIERRMSAPSTDRTVSVRPSRGYGVNDGRGVMFVGHTGKIYPSGFLPIECGRFPKHHLVEVYQRSPLFLALRDASQLQGKCGECEFRK